MATGRTITGLLVVALLGACGRSPDTEVPAGVSDRQGVDTSDPSTEDGDARVLEHLRKAGSDLSVPTDIRWTIHLSEKSSAAFRRDAEALGWNVEVERFEERWTCICSRTAVPTLEEIRRMGAVLGRLSQQHGGDLDGWEAAVQDGR